MRFFRFPLFVVGFVWLIHIGGVVEGQTCPPDGPCTTPILNLSPSSASQISVSSSCLTNTIACSTPLPTSISNMVDETVQTFDSVTVKIPQFSTFWQSENTLSSAAPGGVPTTEYIILNLTDVFLIRGIKLIFVSPDGSSSDMRPRATQIKGLNSQGVWQTWVYYADDCRARYPTITTQPMPGYVPPFIYPPKGPACLQNYYSGDTSTIQNGIPLNGQSVSYNCIHIIYHLSIYLLPK